MDEFWILPVKSSSQSVTGVQEKVLPLRFLLYSGVANNCQNRWDLLIPLEKVLPLIASDCHGFKKFVVRSVVRRFGFFKKVLPSVATACHVRLLRIPPSPFLISFRRSQKKQEYSRSNGFESWRVSSGPLVCHTERKVRGGFWGGF